MVLEIVPFLDAFPKARKRATNTAITVNSENRQARGEELYLTY